MSFVVHAIVVTYHPRHEQLAELLEALDRQVDRVIVVDNGSPAETGRWLEKRSASGQLQLILLPRNEGVAAGHNHGIRRARELGADAVLLFDQDSVPAADMVTRLTDALQRLGAAGQPVGAVGPTHVDRVTRHPEPFVRFRFPSNQHVYCGRSSGQRFVECDHLITSGCLIPLSVLDRVGGMDEALFIDNVDTEWCFRAMSGGFKMFGVCGAEMMHSLGEGRVRTWIPGIPAVVVHAPVRLYYIVRNHVLLYRRHETPMRWVLQDLPRLLYKAGVFGTTISPRSKNLFMMLKGFRDGIAGRTGPYR
jgi:rhamnosyltransferase